MHDIRLRLAVDDHMVVREAETAMVRDARIRPASRSTASCNAWSANRSAEAGAKSSARKIGKLETCTHLAELLGPAVTTLFQTMSNGKTPDGGDFLDNHAGTTEPPFFINGCHSWRTDGPVVAKMFPQFATKPKAAE